MHTGNQNEIPVAPWHNASRSPSNVRFASPPPSFRGVPGSDGLRISFKETIFQRSENLYEVHLDKRRKIGGGNMVGQATHTLSRPPLPVLNAVPGNNDVVASAASLNGDSSGGDTEFNSREDVEKLLAERPTHKNRNDYKGRMKDMGGYIKKLQACINWYRELENGYLGEQNKLRSLLESEEGRHSDIEVQMSCKIDELTSSNEKHQRYRVMLEESLRKEEADKLVAIKSYEKEAEAKAALENLQFGLLEDQEKATKEMKCLNDQINTLQETNKRLQEYSTSLQQYNSNLQADASKSGDTISKLQKEKAVMTETLNGLRDHTSMLKNQLDIVRSSQQEAIKQREELNKEVGGLRSELQQVREDRDHHLENVQRINYELNKYKELTGKSLRDVNVALTKAAALEETCTSQQDQIRSLQYQLASVNENLKMTDLVAIEAVQENKAQKKLVDELQNHVADLEYQLVEAEKLRKKLHNTILELKGNIRVFCRVRPALQDIECRSADGPIVSYPTGVEYLGCGIDLMHNAQKYSFTFDKVFGHEASQEDVFVEISQLVQSALDGYKVCIFAYGQTGSGKTYTMMGKPQACDQKGLIPRSLEQIFEASQALKCQGWKYKMQASMLEIYNETIRDLLSPTRSSYIDPSTMNKQYTIKHDSNGNTHVSDLTVVDVCSINEVSFLLNQAAQSRSVGRTQMNEQSSRSHFVFTLRISGINDATEQQVQGILNLIDLAGSERLAKSGSTGDRLRETQAINKSLSSLSDVIFAIARKEDHVPYRNSKLTYLLQPCLGGDSKTLMFVNISPEASSANESICSLRFAARVNSCEIGVPRRHTQMRSWDSRLSYG